MTTISTHIACKNTKSLRDKQVQNGSQLKKWYKTIKFGAKVVRYYDKNCHYRDFFKKNKTKLNKQKITQKFWNISKTKEFVHHEETNIRANIWGIWNFYVSLYSNSNCYGKQSI